MQTKKKEENKKNRPPEGTALIILGVAIGLLTPLVSSAFSDFLSRNADTAIEACRLMDPMRWCELGTGLQNAYNRYRFLGIWLLTGLATLVAGVIIYIASRKSKK